jgi:hypothetical protein
MIKLTRVQIWDFFILAARMCLAWNLIGYGLSKIEGGQFGVSSTIMNLPLKEVDFFHLSWYMADHEPFKSFIGISQVVAAALLLYNRTVILGAFIAIPIWANILVWDMTFMGLLTPFVVRISFYLILTFLILWHYKDKVLSALKLLVFGTTTKLNYPVWAYIILPIVGFLGLEAIDGVLIVVFNATKQALK